MPLQADGVQHAGRRLDDSRGGVAFALGQEQALDGDAAEGRQVDDVGVLHAVAEAPARRDERVLQGQGTDLNREIQGHQTLHHRGHRGHGGSNKP